MTTKAVIMSTALERFALYGYLGTSVQQIADAAGTSKSSVLYHFASKEALLEAAMQPPLDQIESMLASFNGLDARSVETGAIREMVTQFVDTLLAHAHALTIFVSQRGALGEFPAIQRANALVDRIAGRLLSEAPSLDASLRLGIGLAGAVFVVASPAGPNTVEVPAEHKREVLIDTIVELCPNPREMRA